MFAGRVASTPDAPAVIDGIERVTYRSLDLRAEGVAEALAAAGVVAGDRVGVCLERSATLIAAMLGIMRLGAAYVPLDPTNPAERLRYIIDDCKAQAVVTRAELAARFGFGAPLLAENMPPTIRVAERPAIDPLAPLYVSYTSGSTGAPKGVVGTHRATVNRFSWMYREFPFQRGEVMAQKTAISFIDSVWETFGPLIGGVPLVVIDSDAVTDPARLFGILGLHRVTRLLVVPSLLRAILDAEIDLPRAAPDLRFLFVSGERFPADLARRFRAAAPGITLINIYGSSEVAADVTAEIIREIDTDEVPIGRPIDNCRIYILDEALNPVPAGETGQLFAGGDVLALGYLNRPDLTAERFVPDPFSPVPGARMFATGDRAHHLPDGRLMYDGRVDDQVKLRGVRIELGEIEAALAAQPGVGQALAALQTLGNGDGRIAAFVTPAGPGHPDAAVLRAALARTLPAYMVPEAIWVVPRMPLNPNGKRDRRVLEAYRDEAVAAGTLPGTPTEVELHRIWCDVLHVPAVDIDANFFEQGGHSLNAVRVFARIRRSFGLDLPISTLFAHSSIRALAAGLDAELREPALTVRGAEWDTTAVISPGPATDAAALFIVGGIGGNVNNLYELGREVGRTRPVIGLQTRGIMGHDMLPSIEAMAADHITHIRRRQPRGPYLLAGYSGGALTAFEIARQLVAAGEAVTELVVIDSCAPGFEISADPMLKPSFLERLVDERDILRDHGVQRLLDRSKAFLKTLLLRGPVLKLMKPLVPALYRGRVMEIEWLAAAAPYRPGRTDCPVLLLRSEPMSRRHRELLENAPLLGWDTVTQPENITAVDIPGNHTDMVMGEGARLIAATLAARH